jgi:hypothetical protein
VVGATLQRRSHDESDAENSRYITSTECHGLVTIFEGG